MKKIKPEDIELRKSTERGGFSIIIGGVPWGNAHPKWHGGHGLAHELRYPGGSSIKDAQDNGYRFQAKVQGYSRRQKFNTSRTPVLPQQDAIKALIADLINRGLLESPADREKRHAEESRKATEQHATETRHRTWTRDGLMALAKRSDLTDQESFAVKFAFKDIFHQDMP